MENAGIFFEKWNERGIKIKPSRISVTDDELEEADDDILNFEKYIKNLK